MKPLELIPGKSDEHDSLIDDAKELPSPSRSHSIAVSDQGERRRCAVTALYCAVYLLIGPTLIVVNRRILKELHFNYPMTLSGLGLLFTSVVCVSVVSLGWVKLEHRERVTLPFACSNLMPVGAAMASTLSFGNAVYLHLPVGYIQMLKAFTPVVTLTLLCLTRIEVPSRRAALSVAGICVGTAIASLGEGSLTTLGLMIMLAAEVSEAVCAPSLPALPLPLPLPSLCTTSAPVARPPSPPPHRFRTALRTALRRCGSSSPRSCSRTSRWGCAPAVHPPCTRRPPAVHPPCTRRPPIAHPPHPPCARCVCAPLHLHCALCALYQAQQSLPHAARAARPPARPAPPPRRLPAGPRRSNQGRARARQLRWRGAAGSDGAEL